jgi:hypothetical protein
LSCSSLHGLLYDALYLLTSRDIDATGKRLFLVSTLALIGTTLFFVAVFKINALIKLFSRFLYS